MQVINETKSQSMQIGRVALAILLLQDFVVVPLLVIVPILGGNGEEPLLIVLVYSLLKAVVALGVIFIAGRLLLRPLFSFISSDSGSESSELPIAVTLLVVLSASWGTEHFGLSLALGAFVAGLIVRRYAPEHLENKLIPKIEAIGFGFFIPLFFIVSGANLDIQSIIANPLRLLLFFALLFVIRGLPQYVLYRNVLPSNPERARFALYVATALPILVAITSLELRDGAMLPETAAALVGAGALSVLVFPLLGDRLATMSSGSQTPTRAELLDEQH
jgi:Kef-type K+ transport system membrane component KefB